MEVLLFGVLAMSNQPSDKRKAHGRIVCVDQTRGGIHGLTWKTCQCRRGDTRQGSEPDNMQNETLLFIRRTSAAETIQQINNSNIDQLGQTTMGITQINFKSHRGVYVKHTIADPRKASRRRRVVMTRMTLPAARSAAKTAASTAHLSATGGGGGVGTLASTLARPVTLASSGLSTLGHAAATGLHTLAYTLHHGEEPYKLRDALSQKTMFYRRNNVCVATAEGEA